MKKFAVFSGFLGSGKTTTMMALTEYNSGKGIKTAMISNDLGHGVNLADNRLALLSGCNAMEMTEDCICYQNENLADRLNSCYDDGCELVTSDIPGFGVGALEHVYHGLTEKYPGQFELAPFTVLIEPVTVSVLRNKTGGDLEYIYHTQLVEADLIVLNKCDLIDEAQTGEDVRWLAEHYPDAKVISINAKSSDGIEKLSMELMNGKASMRRPDIGYCGPEFRAAMNHMSEFYLQYNAVVCCNDFDGNNYLLDLASKVQEAVKAAGYEIPHLKLLAWSPDGDFGKADLLGTNRGIEVTHSFERPCTDLAVIINGSADCPADKMEEMIMEAVKDMSDRFMLELVIFKKERLQMGG